MSTPPPLMPCQRPIIFTPSGGAPPVLRNRCSASTTEPLGTLYFTMNFILFLLGCLVEIVRGPSEVTAPQEIRCKKAFFVCEGWAGRMSSGVELANRNCRVDMQSRLLSFL